MQSIMQYNGGSVVAMVGKNCVAIAADKRLGQQFMTVSTEFQKIFQGTEKTFIGLPGLATDVLTLYVKQHCSFYCGIQTLTDDFKLRAERFRFKINMYKMREERDIEPKTLAHMVSSTLYERR